MRTILILAALSVSPGWTTSPDGFSAVSGDGVRSIILSCSPKGGMRVELDAPVGTEAVMLNGSEAALTLRGTTAGGRFVSDMAVDGISALVMRSGGELRVGSGDAAYGLRWTAADAVIDALAERCGAQG